MVKDENLCVHCGLCAERCPTAAWDMQKSTIHWPHAADGGLANVRQQSSRPRKRLRHQDRDRQRHRLGQCQRPADEGHLPQRRAGGRQELLPVQHPGAAHLVRDPRDARRPSRPRRPGRHHGGAQCRDLRPRSDRSRLRRLLHLRQHLAASRRCSKRDDITRDRRAAGAAVQRELPGRAHAHPDEEHLLRRRAGGAVQPGPGHHPRAAGRDLRQEAAAGGRQHEGDPARLRLRARELHLPAAAARWRRWTPPRGHIVIDGNTAAALGCVYAGATVGAWYPITPVDLADGCVQGLLRQAARRRGQRPQELHHDPGRGRAGRRSAW